MARSPSVSPPAQPWYRHPLLPIVMVALLARLLVAPFFGYRYDVASYLEWTAYLAHHPLADFYGATLATPPDHLPGDLLIFALLGRTITFFDAGFTFAGTFPEMVIRLVPIASDVLLGLLLYRALRGRVDERIRLLAVGILYFNPALFTVSAIWGQWDSFAALIIVTIVLLALGDPRRGMVVWPLLCFLVLIKPQIAVFAPLLLIAQLRMTIDVVHAEHPGQSASRVRTIARERVLSNLIIGAVGAIIVFVAVTLPFGVGVPGQPGIRWTIIDRVHFTIDRYTDVALGAHNLWALLGFGYGDADHHAFIGSVSFQAIGIVLLVAAGVIAVVLAVILAPPDWALWTASFVMAMSIYMFPTRVHERYMLPAIVCLLFMWPFLRVLLPVALALSVTYTLSLVFSMSNGEIGGGAINLALAAVNVALFLFAGTVAVRAGDPALRVPLPKRPIAIHRGA
ncbi:MAG: hypothetical protein WBA46_14645 [Thermomicrobiales bacterium]